MTKTVLLSCFLIGAALAPVAAQERGSSMENMGKAAVAAASSAFSEEESLRIKEFFERRAAPRFSAKARPVKATPPLTGMATMMTMISNRRQAKKVRPKPGVTPKAKAKAKVRAPRVGVRAAGPRTLDEDAHRCPQGLQKT